MKKFIVLLEILCISLTVAYSQLTNTNGGPDGYGYSWRSSDDVNGPAFNWVDISGIGTNITAGLGDDNTVGPFNIGFDLPFYWYDVSTFYLGSNGFVMLDEQYTSPPFPSNNGFPAFPNNDVNSNIVSPFLADLSFAPSQGGQTNPATVLYYSNAIDSLVISFYDLPFWRNDSVGWVGSNTFQIVFNKVDSTIAFNYLEQIGTWDTSYNSVTYASQIGIESTDGLEGLTCASSEKPTDSLSIVFSFSPNPSFTLRDVAVTANNHVNNRGIFVCGNQNSYYNTDIYNIGTADITSPFNVDVNIALFHTCFGSIYTDTNIISSVSSGVTQNVSFNKPLNPLTAGASLGRSYYMITKTTLSDDVSSNNIFLSEIAILNDSNRSNVAMTYADMTTTPGIFGFEEGAVYIEPPYYPIDILTLEYNIVTQGTIPTTGFWAKIWDDSGVNGAPGATPIASQYIDSISIGANGGVTQVHLSTPITVSEGGFYVSYEIGNSNGDIDLGVDFTVNAPVSRQNYEIQNGSFRKYRNNNTGDLMISATIDATSAIHQVSVSKEELFGDMIIYPNPATDNVTIKLSSDLSNAQISIIDLAGKSYLSKALISNVSTLNLNIPKGIYVVKISSDDRIAVRKLVVE